MGITGQQLSGGQVGKTCGGTHTEGPPRRAARLSSSPLWRTEAEGGPSDTRSSNFSRETGHLGFCIKSDF